ncbi:MAG TPA: purine permease [Candidatus Ruania gallistercoris]|uniref:Purine permease n=1 Tax=Candidatus Ruania gallistercoris TaxID=2838746 RepID=A0A9D2J4D9_9MICO|nr:purine permease [Candidatus Ruania gallistercoris]
MMTTVDVPKGQRPEDERLSLGANFTYGLQHVLTMYGGIIAVPLIIGQAAGLEAVHIALLVAAGLFIGGLATMLQAWGLPFFGSQLPLVQGVSFAGVSTMLAIMGTGDLAEATPEAKLQAVFGAVIAASVIGLIVAPFFAKIVKFFPPVVTGTVITVIGLSLMRVAAEWAMGGAAAEAADAANGTSNFGSVSNIGLAAITLAIVLILSKVGVGTISRMSILLGIVLGTIVAIPFGKVDFSGIADAGVIAFPTPFFFGMPTFALGAIVSMFVVILVTMVETTADILAVGEIVETKVDSKRIAAGLRADMLSSAVSPVFNSFTQSAFAQNVGLVAITRVRSRYVVVAAGAILVVLGLLPVVGGVVAVIPPPVLGGAGIVLFGSVAAAGIRTLSAVKYDGNMNLIIVAVGVAVGILPEVLPDFYAQFPTAVQIIFGSGISSAAIFAVVLNLLFNHLRAGTPENPSVFAAGTGRVITKKQFARLQEGDHVEGGKLIRADGAEVPVVTKEQAIAVTEAVEAGQITCDDDVQLVLERTEDPKD